MNFRIKRKAISVQIYGTGFFYVEPPKGWRGWIYDKLFFMNVSDKAKFNSGIALVKGENNHE